MKKSEIFFGLLRLPLDFCAVLLGFRWGYLLRMKGDFVPGREFTLNLGAFLPPERFFDLTLIFASFLVLVFAFFGLYRLKSTVALLQELRRVFSYSIVWIFIVLAYFFITREIFFSRLVLGFGATFTVLLLMGYRVVLSSIHTSLLRAGVGKRRVLLIGANKITLKLAKALQGNPSYKVVGFLTKKNEQIPGLKKLGSLQDLAKVVRKYKVEELIQTSQDFTELQDHEILAFCRENHLEYSFVPDILSVERSNVDIVQLSGLPLIHLKPTPLDGWGKVFKRSMDLFGSTLGLILLSPLLFVVAIGIKLDSPGPVLFTKIDDKTPALRIGQQGKPFVCYKFRTMKPNMHWQRYNELAEKDIRKGGPLVKIKNDPRVTRFGAFLRRWDLDELPQLWNVFLGQMSLVGPRPHLPEEVAKYQKQHRFLLTIKPGMTGISQTSGRSDLNFEEEARLDTFYIKHWTPFLDAKILLKTIGVVFGRHGAE